MSTTIVTTSRDSRLVHPREIPQMRCISIDAPWMERGGGKIKRGADRHYPLLHTWQIIETILRCPLWRPDRMAGVHVWLWITNNRLADGDGHLVAAALGLRAITVQTWFKEQANIGLGQYLRGKTEHALFCVAGPVVKPAKGPDPVTTALVAGRGRHSEKPPAFFAGAARVSPAPRAEIFAREPRVGWWSWGNDSALAVSAGAVDADWRARKPRGHLPGCELGFGDGEEVWSCAPGCPDTRPDVDLVRGASLANLSGEP